jgi:NAD-dependent dihydropyrimidine dehydrogenase PreA subunit
MPSVPTVDMDGCVRGMSPLASCRACVDSCPQGAWTLLDRGPALDAGRCDGCGHCQAACPQQAIGLAAQPQLREDRRGIFAVAICEPAAAAADGAWTLPCLHMLGWRQLVGLRRQGVDRLYACRLACDGCPRAATTRLDEHLAVAKRWWAAGADPGLEVVFLSRQGFADRLRSSEPAHPRGTSRRRLLTRWLAPDEPPARQGLLEVFVPEIDPASCSGCDACARLCPTDALAIRERGEGLAYVVDGSHCTGCNLCVDVCEDEAVSVRQWAVAKRVEIGLRERCCPSCKVAFHRPEASPDDDVLCAICRLKGVRSKRPVVLA